MPARSRPDSFFRFPQHPSKMAPNNKKRALPIDSANILPDATRRKRTKTMKALEWKSSKPSSSNPSRTTKRKQSSKHTQSQKRPRSKTLPLTHPSSSQHPTGFDQVSPSQQFTSVWGKTVHDNLPIEEERADEPISTPFIRCRLRIRQSGKTKGSQNSALESIASLTHHGKSGRSRSADPITDSSVKCKLRIREERLALKKDTPEMNQRHGNAQPSSGAQQHFSSILPVDLTASVRNNLDIASGPCKDHDGKAVMAKLELPHEGTLLSSDRKRKDKFQPRCGEKHLVNGNISRDIDGGIPNSFQSSLELDDGNHVHLEREKLVNQLREFIDRAHSSLQDVAVESNEPSLFREESSLPPLKRRSLRGQWVAPEFSGQSTVGGIPSAPQGEDSSSYLQARRLSTEDASSATQRPQ